MTTSTWTRPLVILPHASDHALIIKHTFKTGWEQWYLLTGDEHWDSPECYIQLLHKHLKQAKERNALWINNGDFWEAISSKDDRRGSKETLIPKHNKGNYLDRLVDDGIDEFRPYLNMLVQMGTGNHEQTITSRRETDLVQRFIDKANDKDIRGDLPPIKRAGYTSWVRFMFQRGGAGGARRLSHAMKLEHGTGGNSPVTKGTIQTNRRAARTEGATFFVSSHIHEQWNLSGIVETLNITTSKVEQRLTKHVQVGSYRRDFSEEGAGTWIMQKSGTPKPVGGTWIRFYCDNGNDLMWEVQETWVDYPRLSDYLRREQNVVADRK
jgi:hypothetical protein